MIRVRGGRGLGDALYVRPVAEHLAATFEGTHVSVLTDYPDVYLGADMTTEPFTRSHGPGVVVAHYVNGKSNVDTTQWQDVKASARVPHDLPLKFHWKLQNGMWVDSVLDCARNRPLVVVNIGHEPMAREDRFGRDLLPDENAVNKVLREMRDLGCYIVRVGRGVPVYSPLVDLDLSNATSITQLLDLAFMCDAVVAQCSFAIPLAEVFGKPLLAVWSRRAMESQTPFIRTLTPHKVLSAPGDSYLIDVGAQNVVEQARCFVERFLRMEARYAAA